MFFSVFLRFKVFFTLEYFFVILCVWVTYNSGLDSERGDSSFHNDPLENEGFWEAGWWTLPGHEAFVCVEKWE